MTPLRYFTSHVKDWSGAFFREHALLTTHLSASPQGEDERGPARRRGPFLRAVHATLPKSSRRPRTSGRSAHGCPVSGLHPLWRSIVQSLSKTRWTYQAIALVMV